jgi:hypothetical protein
MRLLAIGYPLPHVDIDNYTALTAPSYFDYEAMVVDPASITAIVRQVLEGSEVLEAFDGRPIVNGSTTAAGVSIADQLRRRADETAQFLEAGRAIVVMGRPNATIPGVVGFEGCDRYSWLPAPPGVSWAPPFLRAAEGRTIRIRDEVHPLAGLFRRHRGEIAYRAVFDDRQPLLARAGHVLATAGTSAPIAVEFAVLGGRVIFIPAFTDAAGAVRSGLAESLVDVCRQLLGASTVEDEPYWARTLPLPGLEQVEAELEEAEADANTAAARVTAVRERQDALAGRRRLLSAEGGAFVAAVADAFRLLGFTIVSAPGEPLVVEAEGTSAFVECESSREQVVEWPYVRLQRRLEERLLKTGEQPSGIVVANGFRMVSPESRSEEYSEPLRVACENYRYGLITGDTLFALVQRALGGAGEEVLGGMRRRILRARGLLPKEAALGEVEEGQDTGPIF